MNKKQFKKLKKKVKYLEDDNLYLHRELHDLDWESRKQKSQIRNNRNILLWMLFLFLMFLFFLTYHHELFNY